MPTVININGKRFDIPDGSGNITVSGQQVLVDGVALEYSSSPSVLKTVEIVGNVNSIRCDQASVHVKGDVLGDVSAGGSVEALGRIGGSVRAGGSVTAGGSVGGSIRAGGSVISGTGMHF